MLNAIIQKARCYYQQLRPHIGHTFVFSFHSIVVSYTLVLKLACSGPVRTVALIFKELSPSPWPYLALCAHVMPLWKPSSRHTTLASLMSTSSSQTVPHVLLYSTSTRPSFTSRGLFPTRRTLAAGARGDRRGEVRRCGCPGWQRESRRTALTQRVTMRIIVSNRRARPKG